MDIMLDFQQKRKLRSVAYNRITLVLLALLVLFAVRSVWGVYQKQRESMALRTQAQLYVNELSAREAELHTQIDQLATTEGVESEIRSKFSVAKEGENMAIVVDDEGSATSTHATSSSWWQKFLDLFRK